MKYKIPLIPKCLNLLTFNVRSLVDTSRQVDLANTLFFNKIDVAFIQECHLKKGRNIKLRGYKILYDYSRIGVAVVLKESIKYNRINIDGIDFLGTFLQIDVKIIMAPTQHC